MSALGLIYRRLAVRGEVRLGTDVHTGIGSRIWSPGGLIVEDDVYIGKYCTIECNGVIGAGTLIANNVGLVGRTDHDMHEVGVPMRRASWAGDCKHLQTTIFVGRDCWIGFGAILLGSVRVGDSTVVGAGSVVTTDLPPNSVCVGNPARPIRQRFSPQDLKLHEASLNENWS